MPERHDTRLRFEQWVKNPDCEANAISAVAGVSMAKVVEAEGGKPTMGQSPFAIAGGETFEGVLFGRKAERLRAALIEADVLPAGAEGFVDFRMRKHGGPMRRLEDAHAATVEFLKQAAAASTAKERRKLPTIAAGACVTVPGKPVMLPRGDVVLDVLTLHDDGAGKPLRLRVGEIKTYADRAGYTDSDDLAGARAQAGVYVHALGLAVEDLGLTESLLIDPEGFLVLSRPGSNFPSVRATEALGYQAERARRGFARLRAAADEVTPFDPEDEQRGFDLVTGAETAYSETCLSFCDRAATCRKHALELNDPSALGEEVARFLGPVELDRAVELFGGAKPTRDAEVDLVRRWGEFGGKVPA